MGWIYAGTGSAPEPRGQGDEAKVLAKLAAVDGQQLPRRKLTRLFRWLRRWYPT